MCNIFSLFIIIIIIIITIIIIIITMYNYIHYLVQYNLSIALPTITTLPSIKIAIICFTLYLAYIAFLIIPLIFIHHLFDALLYIVIVILELSGTGISFKINKVLSYIILGVAQVMTLKHPRVLVL